MLNIPSDASRLADVNSDPDMHADISNWTIEALQIGDQRGVDVREICAGLDKELEQVDGL